MAKVFIDVGGYHGHSVLAAMDPIFAFERIFCLEPASGCCELLRRIGDRRVVVIQACLSNDYGHRSLYHAGTLAGSVYADAPEFSGKAAPETVLSLNAADFFVAFTHPTDQVWMKLNCEGSECDILDSLIEAGKTQNFRNVLIDFDARKIPSQKARVARTQEAVARAWIPHSFPEQVQHGMINNYGGVRNWLLLTGAAEPTKAKRLKSAVYDLRIAMIHPELSGYLKMRILKAAPWLARFARSRRADT